MNVHDLSEPEIDLINYLRGHDEDGNEAPPFLAFTIERSDDTKRWRFDLKTWGPSQLLLHTVGEGETFDEAFVDACNPVLRQPAGGEQPTGVKVKPRLRIVGGTDQEGDGHS